MIICSALCRGCLYNTRKNITLPLPLALSGRAQAIQINSHWAQDHEIYPEEFVSQMSASNDTWSALASGRPLKYNITWTGTTPAMISKLTSSGWAETNYSIGIVNMGNGLARIDLTWTGPDNTSGTVSYFVYADESGRLFGSKGNEVNPATLEITKTKAMLEKEKAEKGRKSCIRYDY